ncbi:MAG: glycosyltransferase [Anaerolineales bacterium]|nr:glycosyltransferase [Anaerolineales bacterium]
MPPALLHDWLNQIGGAEDVLAVLAGLFPGAPIYTSIYWRDKMPAAYRAWPIRASFMDRLPGIYRHHQPYLPLYPLAFERFDLRGHDLLLSNKSGFCHGARKPAGAVHVCYCLTPTRYVWSFDAYAAREGLGGAARALLRPLLAGLRRWDFAAAQRVDHFIAISSEVQRRIAQFYQRESVIIFPPVETARFAAASAAPGGYFLSLGRLIPYKRVDLAVQACTALHLPLLVAGDGRDRARLERLAGPTVKFLGRVPDADVPGLLAGCRAFIFPGLEDFGIAPVQALAAGRPVVAFAGGGALDSVQDGETGVLFPAQTVEALTAALERVMRLPVEVPALRASAARFDRSVFAAQLRAFLREKTGLPVVA